MKKLGIILSIICVLFTSCLVQTVELSSITINEGPTKTEYTVGEKVDITGMVVTAVYSDQSQKTLAATDYIYTPTGALTLEDKAITVTFTDGEVTKTATTKITVKEAEKEKDPDAEKTDDKEKEEESKEDDNKKEDDADKKEKDTSAKNNSSIQYASAKSGYGSSLTITDENGNAKTAPTTASKYILESSAANPEFTLTGYFNGQIVVTKDKFPNLGEKVEPVIILSNAYIENTNGEPAIKGDFKFEIKAEKETTNYVISDGKRENKYGAIHCEKTTATGSDLKSIVLGGKGTCYIIGNVYHGIKGKNIEFKGSGNYSITGSEKGSCINCKDFSIEADKEVTLNLSDAKNGIKADNTISILSGTLNLKKLEVGFKTDTKADDKEGSTKTHSIKLDSCKITDTNVTKLYETEANGLTKTNLK